MDGFPFSLGFEVRDCECDLQGIVNNAVYQQYLEHTRHKFLRSRGLSFPELIKKGIHLIVVRAELNYRHPLRSGDSFEVGLRLDRISPVRAGFIQDIRRVPDDKVILNSEFVCAAMNEEGRPIQLTAIDKLFESP